MTLPRAFIRSRLEAALIVLGVRSKLSKPITEAEAMQYVRYAYMRGYRDSLRGIIPSDSDESAAA